MLRKLNKKLIGYSALATVLTLLSGCTTTTSTIQDGAPNYPVDVSKIQEPVPHKLPLDKNANHSYIVNGKTYHVLKSPYGYHAVGTASWYGTAFNGHKTSTGEQYNMLQMTAASKVLPLPCFAKVTNLHTHKSIIVEINDRGPFEKNRLIDLSYAAALKLGIVGSGTALVAVDTINTNSLHLPKHEKVTSCFKPSENHYVINVATYSQLTSAKNAQLKLRHIGLNSSLMHYNQYYLVQINATSYAQVNTIQSKLKKAGFAQTLVRTVDKQHS